MQRKNRSGRCTVSPTGHENGGGIQGISTASAARAETLSDALGTRLVIYMTNDARFFIYTAVKSRIRKLQSQKMLKRGEYKIRNTLY